MSFQNEHMLLTINQDGCTCKRVTLSMPSETCWPCLLTGSAQLILGNCHTLTCATGIRTEQHL